MVNFFIADENIICKHKIRKNIKAEIILRNREKGRVVFTRIRGKPILCLNFTPFMQTYAKGIHISLFYDKLLSKMPKYGLRTASCHNLQEVFIAKNKLKADFIMLSPVFYTKSHPNAKALGMIKFLAIINKVSYSNFIALGGMNREKLKRAKKLDFKDKIKGFAGIGDFVK